MKWPFYLLVFFLVIYNLHLGSFSALNGEVNFFNDVSRDFLLLQELDTKKIVFIGPRSNTSGLFHGPLWTYINYPAYTIGGGNPAFQAWFWIFLEAVFLASAFIMAKNLFGKAAAAAFVLLLSIRLVPHVNGVFHSEATFFIMPVFFFGIAKYALTKKVKFLILHFVSLASLIQLNIGDGIPFFMLSAPLVIWIILKNKQWAHLLAFLIIPAGLFNFILFDIKHNFQMARALMGTGASGKFFIDTTDWVINRINNIVSLELFERENFKMSLIMFMSVIIGSITYIKTSKKQRPIYTLFMFYYFGYFVLSYFNKGVLLFHYVYLLIPLTYFWLTSFLQSKYKWLFAVFVLIIYSLNLEVAQDYNNFVKGGFMGKSPYSWKGLSATAKVVIDRQKGKEFGYFVFAPDSFAYQPRYAMLYNFKKAGAKSFEYTKKPITYVIAQPPPANDKYMDYKWWVKVPVGITAKPVSVKKLPNGYTILEYHLTTEEQKIPHDRAIELGIHFR